MQWNTYLNGVCGQRQLYMFSYDAANRLTAAAHRNWNGTAWTDPLRYNESGITYDLNGNIKTYNRKGLISTGVYGDIDLLAYTYSDTQRPDRLTKVVDTGNATKGFKYNPPATGNHYAYDAVGNMTTDNHKKVTITYNYLNLPTVITFTDGTNRKIVLEYDADGTKLKKSAGVGDVMNMTKQYVSGIEYNNNNLEAIYFAEGRLTPKTTTSGFFYDYTLKDHLGNARVSFRDSIGIIVLLQENHYYPFGLEMEGPWQAQVGAENGYQYNGKELNEDYGLNWYDYGARWYDAAVGRWWSVDPLSIYFTYESSYAYAGVNPIKNIDINGYLKFPVGSDKTKYSKLYNFLSGPGFKKFLDNPDIRNGLKVIGNWTDENISDYILAKDAGIEIEFSAAPGGDPNANGQNKFSSISGSPIVINEQLAQKLQDAVSLEDQQGALLAIMVTILHETIHWGRNNFEDKLLLREEGDFSRKRRTIFYKNTKIFNLDNHEIGNGYSHAVWRNYDNVTSSFDEGGVQSWINTVRMLLNSSNKDDDGKVPEPRA